MPHAVVELSRKIENSVDKGMLMLAVHKALLASGEFGVKDIKVRLYPVDHALVGGEAADFVHTTIYLLSGRSAATKKALTERVLDELQAFGLRATSISVDARDLDREVYSKVTQ